MMKVWVLRHAQAVDAQQAGGQDEDRWLTERGEQNTRRAADGLARLGAAPSVILTSPYPRAAQTARLTAQALGEPPVQELDLLRPGLKRSALAQWLRKNVADGDQVMIVGHNPDLERLVAWLIAPGGAAQVHLRKGSVALIEIDASLEPGQGTLQSLWTAEQLGQWA